MINNKHLIFVFRLVVGGVFIWAGLLKIVEPLEFAQNIKNYQIFSQEVSFFLALVLPWIEVISGTLLILGVFRRTSALVISGFLAAFLILILVTIARGIDITCGCFGPFSHKVDFTLIAIDSVLCFLSLSIFFSRAESFPLFRGVRPL